MKPVIKFMYFQWLCFGRMMSTSHFWWVSVKSQISMGKCRVKFQAFFGKSHVRVTECKLCGNKVEQFQCTTME